MLYWIVQEADRWRASDARMPILTDAVADRLERALAESGAARLAGIARVDGNPLQVETRHFGRVEADLVGRDMAHYHYFNGPRDLRAADEPQVATLVDWYRALQRPIYVRIAPVFSSAALLGTLASAGLRHSDFMSVLYGRARKYEPELPVDEVAPDAVQPFVDLWTRGAPDAELTERRRFVAAEFSQGWRCYVARLDGASAAYGALYVAGTVGVCAAAATLPEWRGRGLQTALLRRRIADAAAAGCDLIVVQASPGSGSQRNVQRLGLALAYTRATWTW
jgi:GNAT superfamily N-acetyltransferase